MKYTNHISHCVFCRSHLGRNRGLEHLSIGRRIAFDATKGRVWVICSRCERWNLWPFDDRWERAVEAERRFRSSGLRASTENIGLTRLEHGVELIRIGNAPRLEVASWRYGDRLGRRRRRRLAYTTVGMGAVFGMLIGGTALGASVVGFGYGLFEVTRNLFRGLPKDVVGHLPGSGEQVPVLRKHLRLARLEPAPSQDGGWRLSIPSESGLHELSGRAAREALALFLPELNRFGGTGAQVREAVQYLEALQHPNEIYAQVALSEAPEPGALRLPWRKDQRGTVATQPPVVRLALEMVAHEEMERRAIQGELRTLDQRRLDAEYAAGVVDDLTVPVSIERDFRELRAALEADARSDGE